MRDACVRFAPRGPVCRGRRGCFEGTTLRRGHCEDRASVVDPSIGAVCKARPNACDRLVPRRSVGREVEGVHFEGRRPYRRLGEIPVERFGGTSSWIATFRCDRSSTGSTKPRPRPIHQHRRSSELSTTAHRDVLVSVEDHCKRTFEGWIRVPSLQSQNPEGSASMGYGDPAMRQTGELRCFSGGLLDEDTSSRDGRTQAEWSRARAQMDEPRPWEPNKGADRPNGGGANWPIAAISGSLGRPTLWSLDLAPEWLKLLEARGSYMVHITKGHRRPRPPPKQWNGTSCSRILPTQTAVFSPTSEANRLQKRRDPSSSSSTMLPAPCSAAALQTTRGVSECARRPDERAKGVRFCFSASNLWYSIETAV